MDPKAEIAELKEKVRQLEEMLVPASTPIPIGWDLTKMQARIVACLLSSPNKTRGWEAIAHAIWGWREGPLNCVENVRVRMFRLRRKLRKHGVIIYNEHGFGYRIEVKDHDHR